MTDYGHDIRFGTFITPVNRPPRQAVELAQHAERLGFDLAAVVSASHNPHVDNGIKLFGPDGRKLPDAREDAVAGKYSDKLPG